MNVHYPPNNVQPSPPSLGVIIAVIALMAFALGFLVKWVYDLKHNQNPPEPNTPAIIERPSEARDYRAPVQIPPAKIELPSEDREPRIPIQKSPANLEQTSVDHEPRN